LGKYGLGQRAAIFLKAAELIAGPIQLKNQCSNNDRSQSKNIHQAEINASCELIDFTF
jgi:1-pyrroline-5-carboxylate dehydrogenase